ncbi:hypothetical protein PVAP13_9KG306000 [Panicum virgatum]|uniref:Glutathione S-transferase n=1 Tax=Panicum virgatum TaxID=38727 RepID=A0A8T0NN90_PANVG|nr:hypothetical protein PVAP13_9KG306000 [Panicum virgatum]
MAGEGDELKLLSTWFSPFGSRVKLALHLKGLRYEYVEEEDLTNKSRLLLESNPVHKKVPVLFHGGRALCESMVIVDYIEEAFAGAGPPLLPADPYDRAVARFWAAFIETKLVEPWFRMLDGTRTRAEMAEGVKQMLAAVATLEGALGQCAAGRPFFGGDGVGYVDVALGGLLVWVRASEVLLGVRFLDAARTPLLAAWAERFASLGAARAALPDFGRVVEHAKMRRGAAAGALAADN